MHLIRFVRAFWVPFYFISLHMVPCCFAPSYVFAADSNDETPIKTGVQASSLKSQTLKPKVALGERVALVIGNADYLIGPQLNPVNDARDMARVLSEMGFDVIKLENGSQRDIVAAIDSFYQRIKTAKVALFYYSGHGMQVDGHNFLIPIGMYLSSESDIEFEAVDIGRISRKMEGARAGTNIVILDACRSDPFIRSYRSNESGLVRMDAPNGSYIAFATAPEAIAADGTGSNGIFIEHLLKYIKSPDEWVAGLDLADGKWRLPALDKLKTLYVFQDNGKVRMHPAFITSGTHVWAKPGMENKQKHYYASNFTQNGYGGMSWYSGKASPGYRAFAVREAKKPGS